MDLKRDFAKLLLKLKENREIDLEFYSLDSEEALFACGVVTRALSYINQTHLEINIQAILLEFIKNSEFALLKRIFYAARGVDVDTESPEDIENFQLLPVDQRELLLEQLKKSSGLRMRFQISLTNEGLQLSLETGIKPSAVEKRNILAAIKLADEQASKLSSRPERKRGMGIVIAVWTLQRIGLSRDNLKISATESAVKFALQVPPHIVSVEEVERVDTELLADLEALPGFPDHIRKIIDLCDSPDSSAKQIAAQIEKDPSVAGQVIKLANSGGFAGGNVSVIQDAVALLGLNNLKGVMMKIGAFSVLEERYGVNKEVYHHSIQVGHYCRPLARKMKLNSSADLAYLVGLLHDIGKMVLFHHFSGRPEFKAAMESRDRLSQVNLEEIAFGINHAVVGSLLARKWKFPEDLSLAIAYHHTPHEEQKDKRTTVHLIHLANAIAGYQDGRGSFYTIDPETLAFFNMTTRESFEMVAGMLKSAYLASGAKG